MGPGVSTHRQAAGEGRQMAACEEQEDIGVRHSRPFRSLEHCPVVIQSAEPLSYPRLDHLGRKSGPGFGGRQPGRATLMPLCLLSLLIFLFTLFFVCRRAQCRGQRSTYESPFSPRGPRGQTHGQGGSRHFQPLSHLAGPVTSLYLLGCLSFVSSCLLVSRK